jgi:AbrB family looped-hinge helix DNA binding protein
MLIYELNFLNIPSPILYAMSENEVEVSRLYRLGRSNGLALWIPARIAKKLELKPGDKVVIAVRGRELFVVKFEKVVNVVS